jgi:hypothetical protein
MRCAAHGRCQSELRSFGLIRINEERVAISASYRRVRFGVRLRGGLPLPLDKARLVMP